MTVPASDITDNELLALDFGSDIMLEAGTTYAVVLTQATLGQKEYRWCKSTTSFASGKIKEDGSWVQEKGTAASLRVIVGDPADIVEPTPVNILSFELVGAMTMDTTMSDSAAVYSWTDGIPNKRASGVKSGGVLNYKQGDNGSVGTIPEEAGWKLSVPASASVQTLTFVSGVWNSSCEIYIYANGDTSKPVYSNAELNAGGTSKLLTYTVTVAPYTSIEVYGKLTAKAHRDGNMSLCAATLSRSDSGEEDYIAKLRKAVQEAQTLLDEFGDEIGAFQRQQLEEALAAAKTALNNEHLTQSEAYLQYLLLKGAINAAEASDTDKSYANKYASGNVCSFGWEGDKDAPILWVDGTYLLRDNGNKLITFGVDELAPKSAKWYNAEGYLPCFVSEYTKDGLQHKIETFADEVYVNGNRYEIAYSRMTTTNTTDKIQRLPRVSRDLVALNADAAARTVEPDQTVVREYCVGADRFGGTYAYPENEVLAAQGSWAEHYEHMKNYWNKRLETLVKIESVPEDYADLIDAYKAGYIYTLVISDGYELHVGENGYDRVFDHDVIGMLATLIESGHTEHFADYAQFILQNIQYPDAAWKFSWPFALYLQKTGDYDTILSFFENQGSKDGIKSNTHKIASERTVYDKNIKDANGKTARIMKITNAIDSNGLIVQNDICFLPFLSHPLKLSIFFAQQKIRQMHDLDTVDVACGQFVQRYDIFRVMVSDFQQVGNLTVRLLWQIAAHLHIDPLVPPHGYEVDLLGCIFADIYIIALPPKLEVHDVFQHGGNGFRVESHHAVFEGSVRKVELLLRFEDSFALHIVPLAAVDHKCLFQPLQIVINCLHRERAPFAFHEFYDGVGGKSLADILHDILHHTVEQVEVRDIMPLGDVAGDNRIVDTLDDLIGRTLVKISERNDGEPTHADIFVQKRFRRAAAVLLKLQIFGKGQRKDRDRDIPTRQIGGDFAGHQLGIRTGHINIGVGILQQTVDRLFPTVHLLHFVQQKIVAFTVGHFLFDVTVHLLGGHAVIQLLRGIA